VFEVSSERKKKNKITEYPSPTSSIHLKRDFFFFVKNYSRFLKKGRRRSNNCEMVRGCIF